MSRILDGLSFDMPPSAEQVIALAHLHRMKLDEAIFHNEIHLGEFGLAQRKRVYDFTRELDVPQREAFYQVYNGELLSIADEDDLHPAEAEGGLSVFAMIVVLVIIAAILYFAVIRAII
ncbi:MULTISPECIES: hypothetical protein [Acinetobacter]|mgnify:FL=1|uniref:Uncharacterized protein n=1 Tax=Acinetobacter chengduensis TaxID=2420890 RepID=A0ABX9TYX1_9GAMM|nr:MULTISPECIES: hypothetical protein [Acinetobacter]MBI1452374.1 hypothetical protein [Acinetobacter sp. FL51]RKG44626.1 hypothetical protein D7V31_00040 [Acinetobacter sp. WCHAc060007]RLL23390.1 hypothetical protein D9K81_03165 [Acinetobacter chengduensis]